MKILKRINGFTIVELIIVITVIGVLAATTFFILSGWRAETARTEVKNELQTIDSELTTYSSFNGEYPASLADLNFEPSGNVQLSYSYRIQSDERFYCLNGASKAEPTVKYYSKSLGGIYLAEGTCPL